MLLTKYEDLSLDDGTHVESWACTCNSISEEMVSEQSGTR